MPEPRNQKPDPIDEAGRESFPASDPPAHHLEGPAPAPLLLKCRPMLAVADLSRTMAFYREKLGFRCRETFGDPPVWCDLERDGVSIMFSAPPLAEVSREVPHRSRDSSVYYFNVSDVVALHKELRDRGANPTDLRITVYGMHEFEVRDPDGIWLWFGQPMGDN